MLRAGTQKVVRHATKSTARNARNWTARIAVVALLRSGAGQALTIGQATSPSVPWRKYQRDCVSEHVTQLDFRRFSEGFVTAFESAFSGGSSMIWRCTRTAVSFGSTSRPW